MAGHGGAWRGVAARRGHATGVPERWTSWENAGLGRVVNHLELRDPLFNRVLFTVSASPVTVHAASP